MERTRCLSEFAVGAGRCERMSVMSRGARRRVPHMALVLPWIGLLIAMSTITYGLDLFATAFAPAPSGHVLDDATLLHDAVLEWSGSPLDAAGSRLRVVTITGLDTMTGADRRQVQCVADSARVSSDVLLVDPKDFAEVLRALCE